MGGWHAALPGLIRYALMTIHHAPDAQSAMLGGNVLSQALKVMAQHEKERDQAMGMSHVHRVMRRGG